MMSASVKAGSAYCGAIFLLGFILGIIRVLLLARWFGVVWAVLIELAIILTASWFVCGWTVRRFAVSARIAARLTMGLVAFGLLMFAEILLATVVGQGADPYIRSFTTPESLLGLAGQIIFAVFPLIRLWTD